MIFLSIIFSWHSSVKKRSFPSSTGNNYTFSKKKKKEEIQDSLIFRVKERVMIGGGGEFFGARVQGWVGRSEDDRKALVPARPMREGLLGGWRETKINHQFCSCLIYNQY